MSLLKGGVPAEFATVDERSAELGFTRAALLLVALLLSLCLFEADSSQLLQGRSERRLIGRRAALLGSLRAGKLMW